MVSFEIIEHTADVGISATGTSAAEVFEQMALGLFDILGAWQPGDGGDQVTLELEANDLGGLMVDWLNEVLYVQDARDVVFTDVKVDSVTDRSLTGTLRTLPREGELDGTAVKAITFHGLSVEQAADRWTARVYVDV